MITLLTFGYLLALQALTANTTSSNTSDLEKLNQAIANLGSNIPTVIVTLGLALLGILIPLTIAILQDIMEKKTDECKNYAVLDLHVILDMVFKIKRLIFFSALIFAPFIFWDLAIGALRIIIIFISFVGIAFILKIVLGVYVWTKGNISNFRKAYLQKLEDKNDFAVVWDSIWGNSKMTIKEEREFHEIFKQKVDWLMNNGKTRH